MDCNSDDRPGMLVQVWPSQNKRYGSWWAWFSTINGNSLFELFFSPLEGSFCFHTNGDRESFLRHTTNCIHEQLNHICFDENEMKGRECVLKMLR